MALNVEIEMMSDDFLVWRCLHGGPLTARSIEQWPADDDTPWADFRARNLPLLGKLTAVYGACTVLARDGGQVVGTARFYPKALCTMTEGGPCMCLMMGPPYGPADDLLLTDFPPLEQLPDKTLLVHCLMLGSSSQGQNPYRRKGLASSMVRALVEWAGGQGWKAIEATAYEDLDVVYALTGSAGKTFWEKLGFRVTEEGTQPGFEHSPDILQAMVEQGQARGLSAEDVKARYTMRLDLA